MGLNEIWKTFRYNFYFYLVGTIILVILIFAGYENKWVPLIAFYSGIIPLCLTGVVQFTDEQDAIDEYDPVTSGSLKIKYSVQSSLSRRWCVHLEIGIMEEYPIVPKAIDLYDKEETKIVLNLTSKREKVVLRGGCNETDKFWDKEVKGRNFPLYLGFPNDHELPSISGDLKLRFIYEIRRIKKERFYTVNLPEYIA